MSTTAVIIVAAVVVVLLVAVISARKNDGGSFDLGTLQTVLIILILVFLAIWLGERVLN